jgi:hypothetical protein
MIFSAMGNRAQMGDSFRKGMPLAAAGVTRFLPRVPRTTAVYSAFSVASGHVPSFL